MLNSSTLQQTEELTAKVRGIVHSIEYLKKAPLVIKKARFEDEIRKYPSIYSESFDIIPNRLGFVDLASAKASIVSIAIDTAKIIMKSRIIFLIFSGSCDFEKVIRFGMINVDNIRS